MTQDIPEDILRSAREAAKGQQGWIDSALGHDIIARALLAERRRSEAALEKAREALAGHFRFARTEFLKLCKRHGIDPDRADAEFAAALSRTAPKEPRP